MVDRVRAFVARMAAEARSVMRSLLRARKVAFNGDNEMLDASAKHLRSIFEERRRVTDPVELEKHLQEGREAAQFLAENLVQAKLNAHGNYEMKVKKEHAGKQFEDISTAAANTSAKPRSTS